MEGTFCKSGTVHQMGSGTETRNIDHHLSDVCNVSTLAAIKLVIPHVILILTRGHIGRNERVCKLIGEI